MKDYIKEEEKELQKKADMAREEWIREQEKEQKELENKN